MKKSEALKILGLSEGYTADDIKQAHRQKIRENHPDRFSDPDEKASAEERTKLINEARDVLVNRKWEPEYAGARSAGYGSYGNPYTGYRPSGYGTGSASYGGSGYGYGRPAGSSGQGDQNDPFGDWPFETFVWTSWDGERPTGSWSGGSSWPGNSGPTVEDWFSSVFTRPPEKTPAQEMEEAKRELKFLGGLFLAKMAMLALCTVTGTLPVGVIAYLVLTLVVAARYEAKGCSSALMLPVLLLVVLPLAVAAGRVLVAIWPLGVAVCIVAVVYDIGLLRRMWSKYRTAKEKAGMTQD